MRQYLVREVMSHPPLVVRWGDSILTASALMEERDVRRVPVIDDDERVIGIISLGDVREATSVFSTASPYAPDQDEIVLAVDEVMTTPVITVGPEDKVRRVVELMLEHKIGGVPVVDDSGRAVGMVTESDVFRLLLQAWDEATAPA